MKAIISAAFILFVLSFAASCAVTHSAQQEIAQNANASKIETNANNSINSFKTEYFPPDTFGSTNDSIQPMPVEDEESVEDEAAEKPKYAIELLMNSEYYAEEVETSVGVYKGWLGLYRKKNKYFLLSTTIEIKAVSHDLRDAENSKEKTGRRVSSNIKLPNVFLLKNAKTLRKGEVKTVFYGNETDSDAITGKYRREFDFNGRTYTLFVEDASGEEEEEEEEEGESEEYLTAKSKMMLSEGKTKQTIYEQEYCSDCSWDLCWVGDLDADGKLDFLFNLSSHYNSTCHVLFLSSQAKKGEIVRDVAENCQMGC